jgi:hypothetical protein
MAHESNQDLLSIIGNLEEFRDKYTSKKTIQKLVYLIQEAGHDVGFDYSMTFYGPYSGGLDYALYELENDEMIRSNFTPEQTWITCIAPELPPLDTLADKVIAEYGRYPNDMLEQYTTVLYVIRESQGKSKEEILGAVKRIKGEKYSSMDITRAIAKLRILYQLRSL